VADQKDLDHPVTVTEVASRPTAVVVAVTTWPEFPSLWPVLSGEVWTCLRAAGITRGCRNIMRYLDGRPSVEVGVELTRPCPLTGRVVASELPAARVAMTTHWGSYAQLGEAHDAVVRHCEAHGLTRTGQRWEVYGPHSDDQSQVWTEVCWELA
jgi:effector-binding domain-containing protein